jgi:hypothetical protein
MKKLLTILFLVTGFAFACAQPKLKPPIRVSVRIVERDFEDTFRAIRNSIEKRIADSVSRFLSISYPVFAFTSDTKPDVISIEIKRPWAYRKAALSYPVDLVIRFAGPNVEPLKKDSIKWTIAPENRWPEWLTNDQDFATNLMVRFKDCIDENEASFFRLLRCRRFVERVGELKIDQPSKQWILNLSYADLGTGLGTQFKVLQNHSGPRVLRYYIEAKSPITSRTIKAVSFRPDAYTDSEPSDNLNELASFQSISSIQVFKITPFTSTNNKPISSTEVTNGNHH